MRFDVITLFPELVEAIRRSGVVGRAFETGLAELKTWNPRDFTGDRHRRVDDRSYGGGPGMVMQAAPLADAVNAARQAAPAAAQVIFLSPQGQPFRQKQAEEWAQSGRLILVAGRYEGVDERFRESCVDMELSLGDFVISGGELAAMTVVDAVVRLLPGALGHALSATEDSFADGMLDYPHYTRPERWERQSVPAALLSGDHEAIRRWRLKQALGRTWRRRPALLESMQLDCEKRALLQEYIAEQSKES